LGIVTLIFSLVEKSLTKHPDRWDLSGTCGSMRLGLKIEKNIGLPIDHSQWISRFESVSIIIACTVALVWITGVQSYPFLILGPAATFLRLAPVWRQVYFPIVFLTALEIVRAVINLVRPDWTRFRRLWSMGVHAAGLAVLFFLIRAGSWVTAADSTAGGAAGGYAHAAQVVNQCIFYGFWVAGLLSAAMLVVKVVRLIRQPRQDGGSTRVGEPAKEGN